MTNTMNIVELKKGELLSNAGEDTVNIYFVKSGKLKAYTTYGNFIFSDGAVAGIADGYYGINIYTYVADTDCTLEAYSFNGISDVIKLCSAHKSHCGKLVLTNNCYIMDMIRCYLTLMMKCRNKDASYTLDTRINKWELDKYNAIAGTPENISDTYFSSNAAIAAAEMAESARFVSVLNDACLEMADFLGINMDYIPSAAEPENASESAEEFNPELLLGDECDPAELAAALQNSLDKIIAYSRLGEEDSKTLKSLMNTFKKDSNKLSSDDDMRILRKRLTDMFYKLYYNVFIHSLDDDNIPNYISMFLNFGYIDEELVSENTLMSLYRIVHNIENICNSDHVYTMYNWLKHIFWGEKEPSRNSLDQNYEEYVREQARLGKIKEADALGDNDMKLRYEINNMFLQTHRMTYGRVSSFVPFLIEDNVFKAPESMLVSSDALMKLIDHARSIDFSLFFRSTVYSNESIGINKEYIYEEVLPDIILTPCIGSYGAMWQEIAGRKRTTSARFMFPIFCNVRLDSLMLNVLGHFRWELCKRIQGTYWNNVSEKSLTSEFYDYLQFYRKNRDLTDNAKDKIKSTLTSARNNFSEVFARDYELWITYESRGSSRLNKVSRLIMAKYCPFNKAIRHNLKLNPTYTKDIEIYERNCAVQKKHFDLLCRSLEAKAISVPDEIIEAKAYLDR